MSTPTPVSGDTPPFLVAPRQSRPKGMPSALCGLCPRTHFAYATDRASEVNESGQGNTRSQFVRKWKAMA